MNHRILSQIYKQAKIAILLPVERREWTFRFLPLHKCLSQLLLNIDIAGSWSLLPVCDLVGNLLALLKRLESMTLDGAVVDEHVVAAIIRGDESESLGLVEPLDCSVICHGNACVVGYV